MNDHLLDVAERLAREYADRVPVTTLIRVVRESDLAHPGEPPEAVETEARSRLDRQDGARPLDGHPLDGHPLDGHPLDGHPLDGHPLDGHPLDGHPLDGHPLDGHRPGWRGTR